MKTAVLSGNFSVLFSDFSGLSIITVGDLFQLKPVFDQWIFENSKEGYNALATNLWQLYFQILKLTLKF
jgi:hypothetical protein